MLLTLQRAHFLTVVARVVAVKLATAAAIIAGIINSSVAGRLARPVA